MCPVTGGACLMLRDVKHASFNRCFCEALSFLSFLKSSECFVVQWQGVACQAGIARTRAVCLQRNGINLMTQALIGTMGNVNDTGRCLPMAKKTSCAGSSFFYPGLFRELAISPVYTVSGVIVCSPACECRCAYLLHLNGPGCLLQGVSEGFLFPLIRFASSGLPVFAGRLPVWLRPYLFS